jgi:aminocarboxymuconate-semialdehyde decarboxylase
VQTLADGLTGGFDVHAHWFGAGLPLPEEYGDPRRPRLVVDSPERGRIMLGERHFRDVPASLWDVDRRVADLDRAGIAVQLVSPVPVTFPYDAERAVAVRDTRATNDSIAHAVERAGGRLHGLGTVPLPHVADSVAELERLMTTSPLRGVEIGARIGDRELDDPALLPFFEAAEALGALVFVHPVDGGGGSVRRGGQPYDFGLGMHTDTALAATALVFGGVLERFPGLRVVLAHGCGGFAWTYPRLRLGAELFGSASPTRLDELTSALYVDSLVLDPEHLRLLEHRFGASRILLGTDHPFFPSVTSTARDFLAEAEGSGALAPGGAARVFVANGRALLADEAVVA